MENQLQPETEELKQTAWFLGLAGETGILRPHAQTSIYRFIHEWKKTNQDSPGPLIFMCHRRLGKSWLLALMCVERCLQAPHQEVKYGAPTYLQCRDIVRPHIEEVLRTCPWQLRPKKSGLEYTFHNPAWGLGPNAVSRLKLIGCNVQDGDRLRGQAADMVVLDEVREIERLDYIATDVIGPQFVGRKNPLFVLISTPPASMDHDLTKPQGWIEQAETDGRFKSVPVTINADFSRKDDKLLTEVCKGKETNAWKREALCELVADETELICPEFLRVEKEVSVEYYPRPPRFVPIVCMDTGWSDRTAVTFSYIDFPNQILVFERSLLLRYTSTGLLAEEIRKIEEELWPKSPVRVRRFADATAQQLDDLRTDHKLYFQAAEKHDRDATIANFRDGLLAKKIRFIRSTNMALVYQLRNGIWNRARTDFERTENMGHWDAGIAACYAYRMAPWKKNPALPDKYDKTNTFNPFPKKPMTSMAEAFSVILGKKRAHA